MTRTPSHPIVDVGIPTYGRAPYLVEAIESVRAQTFAAWRLTISEDGGADAEKEAALAPYLADPRIRYLPSGERTGDAGNHTRLVALSAARYVAILHHDDRWDPGFLERRVRFLESHPSCALVFSGVNKIDAAGDFISRWSPPELSAEVHSSDDFIRLLLRVNVVGYPPSVVVRRSAYEDVGPYFDARYPHADYEMWLRLALRFPIAYLREWDAHYRVHHESTTFTIRPSAERVLQLADHFVELTERERPGLLTRTGRRRVRSNLMLDSISFDVLRGGDRAYASYLLLRAVLAYPPSLLDRRVLDWVRVVVGRRGRRVLSRLRSFAQARGLPSRSRA